MDRNARQMTGATLAWVAVMMVGGIGRAEVVGPPSVTGSFTPYNGSYPASNAADGTVNDYASLHGGTSTYVDFDFGSPVTFDRAILINRNSPAADDRFSQATLTYDVGSDTFATNSNPGASDIYSTSSPVTTQTVHFKVDAQAGAGPNNNTGLMEAIFLNTPYHAASVAGVNAYNSATAYNGSYATANAANGVVGFANSGIEYASAGQGSNMFVDFDLGAITPISGFDYIDRLSPSDRTTGYKLIFSNASDFSSVIATQTYTGKTGLVGSDTYNTPIDARYVRLQATASSANSGVSEMIFYQRDVLTNPAIVTAPSQFNTGEYSINHLFDNQLTGVNADWAASGEGPTTMVLDFGHLVNIDGINWANRNDSGNFLADLPESIEIQFSHDAVFDASDPIETVTGFALDQLLHAYMFASHDARYLRITVTGQNPPAGNVGGAQLNFFGVAVPSPAALPAGLALMALMATRRKKHPAARSRA